jgi:hypothetical protein
MSPVGRVTTSRVIASSHQALGVPIRQVKTASPSSPTRTSGVRASQPAARRVLERPACSAGTRRSA